MKDLAIFGMLTCAFTSVDIIMFWLNGMTFEKFLEYEKHLFVARSAAILFGIMLGNCLK